MNYRIRHCLTIIILLLLPVAVQAAHQQRPSFYARYERFSTRAVYSSGMRETNDFNNNFKKSERQKRTSKVLNTYTKNCKSKSFKKNNKNVGFFDDDKSACLMLNEVLGLLN